MAEAINAGALQTAEISTGNVATVADVYDSTKPNNGARNPLGTAIYLTNSSGQIRKYRYVQLKGTGTPSTSNTPGLVYWKDNSFQVVTPTQSEGLYNNANIVAGILLNTSATASGNGSYVWIQVYGHLASCQVPASTAVGDFLVGGGAAFVLVRVAANTAPTNRAVAIAEVAVASNKSDVFIVLES